MLFRSKLTGDKVGDILFSYDAELERVIKNYYEKGGDKTMTFLHVHSAGRLLNRCEKTFLSTHEEIGKECAVLNCDDSYTHTYNDFKEYFQTHKKGYFVVYRDSIAAAVENAATDSGLKVPEDVEVLSLVGTKYANIVRPTLSAMHIDMSEVGRRAMNMLSDLLSQNLVNKQAKFEAVFVEGQSTIHRE